MTAIAIIAEYNPFHCGHESHIRRLRQLFGSQACIIVFMSGSFVQRGEPALFDKWARAAWAVAGGADCVFELPCAFALSSAEDFAAGGVRLARRLGCTHLSCGVEAGSADDLNKLAAASLTIDTPQIWTAARREGITYGTALARAIQAKCPQEAVLLQYPNALLALEYAKAMIRYGPDMELIPLQRQGRHDGTNLTGEETSASAIRRAIGQGRMGPDLAPSMPKEQYDSLQKLLAAGAYTDYGRYGDLILYEGRRLRSEDLAILAAFTEGLENRWHTLLGQAPSWEDGLNQLKTRRYSRSRLCRMGAYTVLNIRQAAMDQWRQTGPAYARLLALNHRGGAFLRQAKKRSLPIITKMASSYKDLSPIGQALADLDILATDIQHLCFHAEGCRSGRQDFYHSPIIIP